MRYALAISLMIFSGPAIAGVGNISGVWLTQKKGCTNPDL